MAIRIGWLFHFGNRSIRVDWAVDHHKNPRGKYDGTTGAISMEYAAYSVFLLVHVT